VTCSSSLPDGRRGRESATKATRWGVGVCDSSVLDLYTSGPDVFLSYEPDALEVRAVVRRYCAASAASVGVPEATVYRWVKQERIDRGELAGTSTVENAELRSARRRIVELEAELATVKRATELFAEGRVVRPKALFAIVETLAREGHGTKRVCRLLRVAPSGFFRWRSKAPSDRAIRRAWLTDVIGQIHERSRRTYGHRRIRAELDDAYGQRVNKKLIQAIMRELGIAGLPARRRPKPNPAHRATTEDLVNRDFHRDGPNHLWMTDITEHPTREGKVYCCVVLDAWSRKVVGWSIDRRPTAAMVNAALGMAVDQRTPPRGALVHSEALLHCVGSSRVRPSRDGVAVQIVRASSVNAAATRQRARASTPSS
jgi:putative transposase